MTTDRLPSIVAVLIGATVTSVAGSAAQAHVRWFTDPDDPSLANFGTYALTDPAVIVWVLIADTLVAIAVVLDGRLPRPTIANTKVRHDAVELMQILVGMSLLLTAYGGQVNVYRRGFARPIQSQPAANKRSRPKTQQPCSAEET